MKQKKYEYQTTTDGLLTQENLKLMSYFGDNYVLLDNYFYLITQDPRYYFADIGCQVITSDTNSQTDLVARPLKLGDVMMLNSVSDWGSYPKSITLSVHGIKNYGIQVYYNLLNKKMATALYSSLFHENFISPALEVIEMREGNYKMTEFNPEKAFNIYEIVEKLEERKQYDCGRKSNYFSQRN